MPEIIQDSINPFIQIDNVWNPLIDNCVPNTINQGNDQPGSYIITGPNMGGKSTFLRSVGLAVYLA